MKIKGTTVIYIYKKQVGLDPFNAPIVEDVREEIENVLIAPSSTDDVTTSVDLYGKKAVYTLAIPKEDNHSWVDVEVEFFGRRWRTVGIPQEGIEDLIPLDWNKKVWVETYE